MRERLFGVYKNKLLFNFNLIYDLMNNFVERGVYFNRDDLSRLGKYYGLTGEELSMNRYKTMSLIVERGLQNPVELFTKILEIYEEKLQFFEKEMLRTRDMSYLESFKKTKKTIKMIKREIERYKKYIQKNSL